MGINSYSQFGRLPKTSAPSMKFTYSNTIDKSIDSSPNVTRLIGQQSTPSMGDRPSHIAGLSGITGGIKEQPIKHSPVRPISGGGLRGNTATNAGGTRLTALGGTGAGSGMRGGGMTGGFTGGGGGDFWRIT